MKQFWDISNKNTMFDVCNHFEDSDYTNINGRKVAYTKEKNMAVVINSNVQLPLSDIGEFLYKEYLYGDLACYLSNKKTKEQFKKQTIIYHFYKPEFNESL